LLNPADVTGVHFHNSQAPESWLEWVGWRKLVFGLHANRKWHYTGPLGQPNRHVKWFIRSIGAPQPETIINLWESFKAWVTCGLPPWIIEAREAAEEEAAEEAKAEEAGDAAAEASPDAAAAAGSEKAPSTTSSVRSARALARYKRTMAATGFVGTYICWAVFTWCACAVLWLFQRRNPHCHVLTLCPRTPRPVTPQVHLRVRHAHLQAAGRQGAAGVRALLGCVAGAGRPGTLFCFVGGS
jgi:hypothetical protein